MNYPGLAPGMKTLFAEKLDIDERPSDLNDMLYLSSRKMIKVFFQTRKRRKSAFEI